MKEVSFIHASDIHLGHQQFNLEQRFNDFALAFQQVVDKALSDKVDFMVIGGDFFHKRSIDAETLRQAMELLEPLKSAGIPVVAVEGNHDKAFYQEKRSWLNLLNSLGYLRLLKPEYQGGKLELKEWDARQGTGCVTEVAGIRIVGLGYLGATTGQRLTELKESLPKDDGFTILLLHAAVDRLMGQDLGGVRKEVLTGLRDRVDYIALGHIHTRQEIDDWIFNPGSLENCHIDEAKEYREKGFYIVGVADGAKEVNYIPSNPRAVKLLTLDISETRTFGEVRARLLEAANQAALEELDQPMVQVILKGKPPFSALAIDTGALAREIKENFGCLYVEIQNRSNMPLEEGISNADDRLTRNEIERQVLGQLVLRQYPDLSPCTEDLVSLALRIKDAALAGEPDLEIVNEVKKIARLIPGLKKVGDQAAAARERVSEDGPGGEEIETTED